MKLLRSFVFWCHLAAGVTAGLVILVMCGTGALLALKPQALNWIDRDVRFVHAASAPRLDAATLLSAATAAHPGTPPASLAIDRDPSSAAAVSFGRDGTTYVNPYTGAVLGDGSAAAQAWFRSLEDWHRWLAVSAENRATARAVTGASTLVFLGLAASGIFLWWPRRWCPQHVKAVLRFRRTSSGRARDFNWHNVIGFWCAPIIVALTVSGVVMAYPWANDLLYRVMGSVPPAPAAQRGDGAGAARRAPASKVAVASAPVDEIWTIAERQLPTWRSITMRLPARAGAPVTFTMTDTQSWNAFARSQLSLDAATGAIVQWQPYERTSLGQKARGWVRFGHTGEIAGVPGQIVAAVGCLGGVMLVWTGLSLAVRRLLGSRLFRPSAIAQPLQPVASDRA